MAEQAKATNQIPIIMAGFFIVLFVLVVVLMQERPQSDEHVQAASEEQSPIEESQIAEEAVESPVVVISSVPDDYKISYSFTDMKLPTVTIKNAEDLPQWRKNAVATDVPANMAKVVIIIDDLGPDGVRSRQALDLPGPLTVAILPYASNAPDLARQAKGKGHELMVHMPMEPINSNLDTGSITLVTGMTTDAFLAELDRGLSVFPDYVGVNNHMGSRLTQDEPAMALLMRELSNRGLLFIDSKTIASSVAVSMALKHNVPYESRDIFLDHEKTRESVDFYLKRVEEIALRYGSAIAIGHPKDITIEALREWLPTLAEKGLVLVPVSAIVKVSSTDPKMTYSKMPSGDVATASVR